MTQIDVISKDGIPEQQRESFKNAARPLMEWLATNMHPHAKALIESTSAELLEGSIGYRTDEFLVD